MTPTICSCGQLPYLMYNENTYDMLNDYCYFCDCGETGYVAKSPYKALEYWNFKHQPITPETQKLIDESVKDFGTFEVDPLEYNV